MSAPGHWTVDRIWLTTLDPSMGSQWQGPPSQDIELEDGCRVTVLSTTVKESAIVVVTLCRERWVPDELQAGPDKAARWCEHCGRQVEGEGAEAGPWHCICDRCCKEEGVGGVPIEPQHLRGSS